MNIQSAGKLSRLSATVTTAGDTSTPSSPLTATSSPLSEPPDESEYKAVNGNGASSRPRRSMRMGSHELPVCMCTFYSFLPSSAHVILASSKKFVGSDNLLPSPAIPSPVFYDKSKDDAKGTPEVRTPLLAPRTPITSREQQNCEICHKKNRGEEMLLCDGCDCGRSCVCAPKTLI